MTTDQTSVRKSPFEVRSQVGVGKVVATVVTAVLIVVSASVVAWDGEVPGWERSVLKWVNGWPDWLEPIVSRRAHRVQ